MIAETAILWTDVSAGAATGGRSTAPWRADGISIDTRTLMQGDLFIALKGPNFDGHAFARQATTAASVVVDHAVGGVNTPSLIVDDTLVALQDLGRAARARTGARIIAVTGSVGKTGVKDALNMVLSRQGLTSANRGSLNNHWGLPLSLARMPEETDYGVLEMGMNHPGEIEPLSRMARPHVAVVTTVEEVHAQFFDSVEEIADAKAEIFAGMQPDGAAVLNRDNPHYDRLAAAAMALGIVNVIGFGSDKGAKVRLAEYSRDSEGASVIADVGGRNLVYRLAIPGRHWVINSLAVLAAVEAVGADVVAAAVALGDLRAPAGRGMSQMVHVSGGRFQLIDDSYNASPVSMEAAIDVLGRSRVGAGGRHIAVLGDMLELGANSAKLHAALAGPLEREGIDLVFTAGPLMESLGQALPKERHAAHAETSSELAPLVAQAVHAGDVVVVKGSAGGKMGVVVEALRELDVGEAGSMFASTGK